MHLSLLINKNVQAISHLIQTSNINDVTRLNTSAAFMTKWELGSRIPSLKIFFFLIQIHLDRPASLFGFFTF